MRRFLLAALAFAAPPAFAADTAQPGAMGVHGMAIVAASQRLYASHLPMFHAPHDAQLIVEWRVVDAALDAQVRREIAADARLWTLEPERFDLDRLTRAHPARLHLHANLYDGHFERGGMLRHRDVPIEITRVRYAAKLVASTPNPSRLDYVLLDDGATRLAFKTIAGRGDFDHLAVVSGCRRASTVRVARTATQDDATHALANALHANGCKQARVDTRYFETGDLQ